MGLNLFGRSFSTSEGYVPQLPTEPRPDSFVIESVHEVNGHVVALITYPHATNFEGKKILVYRNMSEKVLRFIKLLDPHFSNEGISPFARFIPNEEGMDAAVKLCYLI